MIWYIASHILGQGEPGIPHIFPDVVLLVVYEIPSLHKMFSKVLNNGSGQTNGNVGPTHSGTVLPVELVVLPVGDILEVHDSAIVSSEPCRIAQPHVLPSVVVILSREHNIVKI